ncbi:MAG: glycerophosphodiester phosphodiesterase family protein [Bacteroidota bacterium]
MLKLFLIAIVLLGLLYIWWINTPTNLKQEKSPLVIAHRGSSGLAPENTLAAIQKSIDAGVDMIEVDLHLSKEGEVIILHDATLERTTNGCGEAMDFTVEELQQLDAGSWFSEEFTGEKIPTLKEVFDLVQGKIVLLLELKKGDQGLYEGIVKAVVDQVREYGMGKQVVLQSFESEVVDELVRIAPDMEVHKLYVGRLPGIPIYNDEAYKRGDVLHYPGIAHGFC